MPRFRRAARLLRLAAGLGTALCLAATALAAPLPQAALQKARDAEKVFAAGDVKQAIAAYEKIDAQFPGHPALSLRLAQLHDLASDTGSALFYYRRYAARAGDSVREDAGARLTALELTPGAPEAAEKVAAKKKEKTTAVPPPKTQVRHSIVAQTSDGALRPLNSPQDVEKLVRGEEIPAETPAPVSVVTPAGPMAGQAPGRVASPRPAGAAPSAAAPAPAAAKAAPAQAGPASRPKPAAGTITAPAPQDEDAALAAAFARRSAGDSAPLLSPATTRTVIRLPDRRASKPVATQATAGQLPVSGPATEVSPADFAQVPSLSSGQAPARLLVEDAGAAPVPGSGVVPAAPSLSLSALDQASAPAPIAGARSYGSTPAQAAPAAGGGSAGGFFTMRNIGGTHAQLRLSNTVPDSLLTFAAIPDQGGTPVNAVITPGESRTFNVPPGNYEIVVSAATNDYPPSPLLDRRFEQTFSAGVQYTRRLTKEFLQGAE